MRIKCHLTAPPADYDPSEEYPGTAAFSEPEAALLLRLARALRPHVWTSVHSGMDAIFMPYDHKAEIPGGCPPDVPPQRTPPRPPLVGKRPGLLVSLPHPCPAGWQCVSLQARRTWRRGASSCCLRVLIRPAHHSPARPVFPPPDAAMQRGLVPRPLWTSSTP